MFNQKGFSKTVFIIMAVVFIGVFGYIGLIKKSNVPNKIKNQSIEKTIRNRISYGSIAQGFQVAFPSQPKTMEEDYSFLDSDGGRMFVYISTEVVNGQDVIYKVTASDIKSLSLEESEYKNYYESMHAYYHELMNRKILSETGIGVKVTKVFFDIKNVYKDNKGVDYGYAFESGGYVLLERGFGFIKNGKAWQISVSYPLNLQGEQIEKIYSSFVSSFHLQP